MLSCPNCYPQGTTIHFSVNLKTKETHFNNNKYTPYENIFKDSNKSFVFFNSAFICTCKECKNNYYVAFYYDDKEKKVNNLTFTLEDFQEITTQYYVNSNLEKNLQKKCEDKKSLIEEAFKRRINFIKK